ncbi:hypothetical protein Pint_26945 [Pistacia integerrima]|uniref:Uncharacterized protein n=1 Tax=Pistacia integerrima TaxID=434235 RepID=A0ACC0YQ38_9ROSI|nr:hypothetical protein Pint_26945 [Pistacia integerrima]
MGYCMPKESQRLYVPSKGWIETGVVERSPQDSPLGLDIPGKEEGNRQPLPIPERPWVSTSLDFIKLATGEACSVETAAALFYKNVVKYFGVPVDLVSDRDAWFTGRFWTTLFNMMGTKLKFSTTNHPQMDNDSGDRQGECILGGFCYNMHKSSSTELSPFELVLGQQPLTPIEIARHPAKGKFPGVDKVARDRRPLEFDVGDQVLLKLTPQIWKKIKSKRVHRALVPKYDGPFEVVSRVGVVAYRLKLPERIKVHPTFHVSFLKPFHADKDDSSRTQAKKGASST